jgi:hypothetical protein
LAVIHNFDIERIAVGEADSPLPDALAARGLEPDERRLAL